MTASLNPLVDLYNPVEPYFSQHVHVDCYADVLKIYSVIGVKKQKCTVQKHLL